jgi:hypothetical protein
LPVAVNRRGLDELLSHQLPALPLLAPFLEELPTLFAWLDGGIEFEELPPRQYAADEDQDWSPPATVWTWGAGVPLEAVRFAATNHLLVELRYQSSNRLIEPLGRCRCPPSRDERIGDGDQRDRNGRRARPSLDLARIDRIR